MHDDFDARDHRLREERSGFPGWLIAAGVLVGMLFLGVVGVGVVGMLWVVRSEQRALAEAEAAHSEEAAARTKAEAAQGRVQRMLDALDSVRPEDSAVDPETDRQPLRARQEGMWAWPPALRERFAGRAFGDPLDPGLCVAYRLDGNYGAQVRALADLLAPARLGDAARPRPIPGWAGRVPSAEDVWFAAEDLTVRAALLREIAEVNRQRGGEPPPVSTVESIALGADAADINRLKPAPISPDAGHTPLGQQRRRYTEVSASVRRMPVRLTLDIDPAAAKSLLSALTASPLRVKFGIWHVESTDAADLSRMRLTIEGVAVLAERPPAQRPADEENP